MIAVVQYMVRAEVCESWGYSRLAGLTKARAIEEMRYAEHLIKRIIFLDGTPDVTVPLTPRIGKTVQEHLQLDHEDEEGAVKQYNDASHICVTRATTDGSTRISRIRVKTEPRIFTDHFEIVVQAHTSKLWLNAGVEQ